MSTPAARILVVEDDPLLQELMGMLLSIGGYSTFGVGDGQQAIAALEKEATFDLIILDLMMPVMDGKQFLHWLRQEQQSSLPVLMLTAFTRVGIREELLALGATEVLSKPIASDWFVEQVETLLG